MREAKARIITKWQKRTKTAKHEQEPGMIIFICTLLFFKFDS